MRAGRRRAASRCASARRRRRRRCMSPRSRNCLVTHRPMSVRAGQQRAPAGCAARSAASSSSVRGAWKRRRRRRRSAAASAVALQRCERRDDRRGVERHAPAGRTCAGRRRGSAGSRCSGTGCPTGRRRAAGASAACRARLVVLVGRPQRHHEARACRSRTASRGSRPSPAAPGAASSRRRACAFRSSTVNSALPSSVGRNWMQALTVLQAQAADARPASPGVGQLADHDRAGAAVALVAAFLGAGAARVLAQPVEHRAGRRDAARPRRSRRGGRSGSVGCSGSCASRGWVLSTLAGTIKNRASRS